MIFEYVSRVPPEGGEAQEMLALADCGVRIRASETDAPGERVFSVYAQAEALRQIVISAGSASQSFEVGTAWLRITMPAGYAEEIGITAAGSAAVYLYKAQLEIGAVATAWKAAPEDAEERIDAADAAAQLAYDELESRMLLDSDGLHIGKQTDGLPQNEILIRTGSNPTIDFIFGGIAEASIAKDYHRFGNMEIRVPRVGGFVFQAADGGE